MFAYGRDTEFGAHLLSMGAVDFQKQQSRPCNRHISHNRRTEGAHRMHSVFGVQHIYFCIIG